MSGPILGVLLEVTEGCLTESHAAAAAITRFTQTEGGTARSHELCVCGGRVTQQKVGS